MTIRRRARVAVPLMLTVVLAGAGARADPAYVSTASCAWHRDTIRVVVVPSAYAPLIGTNDGHIDPLAPGEWQPLPEGAEVPDGAETPYVQAAADGVARWEEVWRDYAAANTGAAHLLDLDLEVDVLGAGATSQDLATADVLVVFSPHMGTLGGANVVQSCHGNDEAMTCDERNCIVGPGSNILLSTQFVWSMTTIDVYNITLHEMGHVLGLDHVRDPAQDLMTDVYPYQPGVVTNPRQRISTLNLEQLAESYRWLAGDPYRAIPSGVAVPAPAYEQFCDA